MTAYKTDHLHAVHVRHVKVEHHQVNWFYCQPFNCFEAAARLSGLDLPQGT
jgi:hypothetical protein